MLHRMATQTGMIHNGKGQAEMIMTKTVIPAAFRATVQSYAKEHQLGGPTLAMFS